MASENETPSIPLEEPRMEDRQTLLVAGLMKTYTAATVNEIPLLWRELSPYLGKIPGQLGRKAYGVVYNMKKPELAYLAGVEVSTASDVPDEFNVVRLPDMTYAVFPHSGDVSTLKETMSAILSEWLPASGLRVVQSDEEMPDMLEQYGEAFDPATGAGDIEVWVPIKNRTRTITVEPSPAV
ncbi:MAG TPA: GyrI-like domain-containing protein [Bryobacteraceae bacterium]|jgi:AraC family transcriptional regulator|nr:GyrI-like domain-containing protein [Bryobacteraceae bacterium]